MKILFCDNSLRELINFRSEVIHSYANQGDEVVLLAPRNSDYTPDSPRIKYVEVKLNRSGMNPVADFGYFVTLWKLYRREKPDYIFHYTIKPNIYGSIAAWLCGIPSTAMIAGLGYVFSTHGLRASVGRAMYRFAMRFPQHVFVLNEYNREMVVEKKICKAEKVILLKGGEGVNLELFNA
jgi:hypothetical protein